MTNVADKLREARALIERGWTQAEYARKADGSAVAEINKRWSCFCAVGAVAAATHTKWPNSSMPGMDLLSKVIGGDGSEADVLIWNDEPGRTQAEVVAAFDKAIELAEQSA